jgi:hypothetical protein
MKVKLSESEQIICTFVATQRVNSNRAANSYNAKRSDKSDYEIDLQGFAGELAFCKLNNVFPDFTSDVRSAAKGQDQGDCIVSGLRVDVKTSAVDKPMLWIKARKKGCADVFALMVGTYPEYEFKGFVHHDVVFAEGNKNTFANGDTCYGVPVTSLVMDLERALIQIW